MTYRRAGVAKIKNVPLTEQARAKILEAIMLKRYETRLPAEADLAELLNVSRTTVRAALQSLEQDGIISRKRALGTMINAHVRPSTLGLQKMVGFDAMLRDKGYEVEVEVDWTREPLGEDLAGIFDLDPEQDSMVTDKSYTANGRLAIHVRDALPWANLRNPDFRAKAQASIFEFSSRHWREPVDHAVAEMLPEVKDAPDATELPIGVGRPFTRLHERHYGGEGELIAVSVADVDATFVHFEVFRRR